MNWFEHMIQHFYCTNKCLSVLLLEKIWATISTNHNWQVSRNAYCADIVNVTHCSVHQNKNEFSELVIVMFFSLSLSLAHTHAHTNMFPHRKITQNVRSCKRVEEWKFAVSHFSHAHYRLSTPGSSWCWLFSSWHCSCLPLSHTCIKQIHIHALRHTLNILLKLQKNMHTHSKPRVIAGKHVLHAHNTST